MAEQHAIRREYHEYTSEHSSPGVEYVSTVCQHPIQYFCIFHYIIIHRFHSFGYESIAECWLHLLPMKYRKFVSGLVYDMQHGMNKYFRGQALVLSV